MEHRDLVLELAHELGFDLAGIAPLARPPGAQAFARWLAAGHHAGMEWLERDAERLRDPAGAFPWAGSLLVVGLAHGRPEVRLEDGARVARYAAGRDYHNVIGKRLRKLARGLEEAGLAGRKRAIVDAGPLLERSHAERAGLGFRSKAANLLSGDFGPWFFLGELLLPVELPPNETPAAGSCGTCRACLDACPTDAFAAPGVLDANRCISYHTIENRGSIPRELRAKLDAWVFGCDVCSAVCPWGEGAGDSSARFGTHPQVEGGSLVDWLRKPEEEFAGDFRGSPLSRAKREGLARNAALGLAQAPSEAGRGALLEALDADPSALVREASAWALGLVHADDAGVRTALERALAREPDEGARDDMALNLD